MTKIALIGSAPSSIELAPWADPEWQIWGCSPGAATRVPRADQWFEIHRWQPEKPWFSADYVAKMQSYNCPVWMIEPVPEVANSYAYPKEAVLMEFGPHFLTSSLSWMFAMAIMSGATEIGMWGVDMSHTTEWGEQRPGCHFFIGEARRRGIKVTIPPESDLLQPSTLYGFREVDPMHIKLTARRAELEPRIAELEAGIQKARDEWMFLKGALDDLDYMEKTWVSDSTAVALARGNPLGTEGANGQTIHA